MGWDVVLILVLGVVGLLLECCGVGVGFGGLDDVDCVVVGKVVFVSVLDDDGFICVDGV